MAKIFLFSGRIVVQCCPIIKQQQKVHFVKQLSLWLLVGWLFLACGRLITPTPEPVSNLVTATSTPSIKPTSTLRPTSTPRIATPIASPTPTVSPTPIIYTVQGGDTLLKIALQFDTSTESIQAANGIIDPRFLQIGQQLIIPPPQANSDAPPTPTPTPPPLVVTAINFQETSHGVLWCLGTVENPGDDYLTQVVIEASLFDEAGVLLAREAAFTQLDVVPPGQSVPFAVLFESPPSQFAQYQITAVAGVPLSSQAPYVFNLETFDLRGTPDGIATYKISGQLRNNDTEDVESIRLVAVAYDKNDQVLAQRQATLAVSLLRAGSATPFEIELIIPSGSVDHYEVLAQGLRAQ